MSESVGGYTLVQKLATGGMAEVWLARRESMAGVVQEVVVKRILPQYASEPEFLQLFLNEARLAIRLSHPNIVQLIEVGSDAKAPFLAMEYVRGQDLGRVIRSSGKPLPPAVAMRIVADAAQGLSYAHGLTDASGAALRVVHRDVSPQNLLISRDGTTKVADFGIARAAGQVSTTQSGVVRGKLLYLSPEQAAGHPLDGRSDLYSLGLVLYELLTGVKPLRRDGDAATLGAALDAHFMRPSQVASVSPAFDEVVLKALKKSPQDRYQTGREFQRALETAILESKQLATTAEVAEFMSSLFPKEQRAEATPAPLSPAPVATPRLGGAAKAMEATRTLSTPRAPTSGSAPAKSGVIYRHTAQAFFEQVLARRGLLSKALVDRLRALGVDPAKPRDVELTTWWKVVRLGAEALSPQKPLEEAFRDLGREVLRGYESSLVGKTSFLVLRMMGPRRAVTRLAESFRQSDDFTQVEVRELGPQKTLVRFTVPGGLPYPWYTEGVLLEGLALLGAKSPAVEVQAATGDSTDFIVSWAEPGRK